MGREGLARYERCLLVQHGHHWGVEGEISQPIEYHHRRSLDCWNEGPRIKRSVDDPRMPSDNVTKEKRPFMHLTGGLCMKALSSLAAAEV